MLLKNSPLCDIIGLSFFFFSLNSSTWSCKGAHFCNFKNKSATPKWDALFSTSSVSVCFEGGQLFPTKCFTYVKAFDTSNGRLPFSRRRQLITAQLVSQKNVPVECFWKFPALHQRLLSLLPANKNLALTDDSSPHLTFPSTTCHHHWVSVRGIVFSAASSHGTCYNTQQDLIFSCADGHDHCSAN